ncbi:GNAT family N-acetyltransferase [Roseateles noduli]|uniref:GNAT family N-acetyltransferase n=1 Tax=Roseateles noduli TaxID=2052484 RepID=UPI003D652841
MSYELRALDETDGCNALSLGDQNLVPLKTFLRKEAKRLHKDNLAKTFVMVEFGETRVLAYITLVCTHVSVQQFGGPAPVDGFRYADYPAVKLARLAVDSGLQGQGVGGQLVDFAIGLAEEHIMPYAGCRFLVVDAKPNSVGFYLRKGFSKMGEDADEVNSFTTMFVDLHRLPAS